MCTLPLSVCGCLLATSPLNSELCTWHGIPVSLPLCRNLLLSLRMHICWLISAQASNSGLIWIFHQLSYPKEASFACAEGRNSTTFPGNNSIPNLRIHGEELKECFSGEYKWEAKTTRTESIQQSYSELALRKRELKCKLQPNFRNLGAFTKAFSLEPTTAQTLLELWRSAEAPVQCFLGTRPSWARGRVVGRGELHGWVNHPMNQRGGNFDRRDKWIAISNTEGQIHKIRYTGSWARV